MDGHPRNLRKEKDGMVMTDTERALLPELVSIFQKLPAREQEHLIWIGEGILVTSKRENEEKDC